MPGRLHSRSRRSQIHDEAPAWIEMVIGKFSGAGLCRIVCLVVINRRSNVIVQFSTEGFVLVTRGACHSRWRRQGPLGAVMLLRRIDGPLLLGGGDSSDFSGGSSGIKASSTPVALHSSQPTIPAPLQTGHLAFWRFTVTTPSLQIFTGHLRPRRRRRPCKFCPRSHLRRGPIFRCAASWIGSRSIRWMG